MSAPAAAVLPTESIGGRSDWNGKTYFGKVRYHDGGGMAFTLSTNDHSFCGGSFQFGVRNPGSGDGTLLDQAEWHDVGGGRSLKWNTGSYSIPSGRYSVVANVFGACGGSTSKDVNWTGPLMY